MTKHTICAAGLLAALLASGPAHQVYAQDGNALHDGAWALQFAVGQNFTLTSFQGATISAKHHYSDATALRYGLTLDLLFTDSEGNTDVGSERQAVTFSSYYMMYPDLDRDPDGPIQLYWGAGPQVTFMRQETTTNQQFRRWDLGVSGLGGAEWFIRPRISLTAEYSATVFYRTSRTKFDLTDTAETNSAFGLSANGVRFGVSVYVRD